MNTSPLPRERQLDPRLLQGASVKIVGLGGVGSIVARYGALFLASLRVEARLVLIDGDHFKPANASRMFFGAAGNKAAVVRAELLPRFAESTLELVAVEEFITPGNIHRLIRDSDIVLLTVDNHATRKLVNDHCATLADVCLLSGGNDGMGKDASGRFRRGTYGNVQAYIRADGAERTPPLTRFHPEILNPADRLPTDQSCTELMATVPQILFANLAVAGALLNSFWLHLCMALHYSELALDIADGLMRPVMAVGQAP